MQVIKPAKKLFTRLFSRTVALVCAVCFITVFLLITTLHLNHSSHENATGCPRTFEPVCKCENDIGFAQFRVKFLAIEQSIAQSGYNSGAEAGCITCALINKTVFQLRQQLFAVSTLAIADVVMFALLALCFMLSLFSVPAPTELRVKMSN